MAAARIKGVLSPVVTPFKRDLSPDLGRFIAHCKWLLSQDCGLAVFGNERIPGLPEVPTMVEAGFTQMRSAGWTGLFAPKGTPPEIVEKLSMAISQLYADPAFVERLASVGVDPDFQDPRTFADSLAVDFAYFGDIIETAGITEE